MNWNKPPDQESIDALNILLTDLADRNYNQVEVEMVLKKWKIPDWHCTGSRGDILDAATSYINPSIPIEEILDSFATKELLYLFAAAGGERESIAIKQRIANSSGYTPPKNEILNATDLALWSIGGYHAALGLLRLAESELIPIKTRTENLAAIDDLASRGNSCADEGGQLPVPKEARDAWEKGQISFLDDNWKYFLEQMDELSKKHDIRREAPHRYDKNIAAIRRLSAVARDTFGSVLARCYNRSIGVSFP